MKYEKFYIFFLILYLQSCSTTQDLRRYKITLTPSMKHEILDLGVGGHSVLLVQNLKVDLAYKQKHKFNHKAPSNDVPFFQEDPMVSLLSYLKSEFERRKYFDKIYFTQDLREDKLDYIIEFELVRISTEIGDIFGADLIAITGGGLTPFYPFLLGVSYISMKNFETIDQFCEVEVSMRVIRISDYMNIYEKSYVGKSFQKVDLDQSGSSGFIYILNIAFQEVANDILEQIGVLLVKEHAR